MLSCLDHGMFWRKMTTPSVATRCSDQNWQQKQVQQVHQKPAWYTPAPRTHSRNTTTQTSMKRRAAVTIPSLNAENSLSRIQIQSMHLFTGEVIRGISADANPAVGEGTVVIPIKESLEYEKAISKPRKVSLDGSSADATCLSSSLITQLASISIKEEKKSSTNPIVTPTKHGSFPFTFSKSLQTRIKMAKRPSAPCLTSKKRVHSRRRNRVVILNSKTIMTTTQKERKSIDCLHFESISLSPGHTLDIP